MNPILKRGLAISAIAPLAFFAVVSPAGANVDPTPTPGLAGDLATVDCDHPKDGDLSLNAYFNLEGDLGDGDVDDIDYAYIEATDQDFDGGDPQDAPPATNIDVRSIKVEYFADNFDGDISNDLNERPRRLATQSKRLDRDDQGRWAFKRQIDDVGAVRITVRWFDMVNDDDGEELVCYIRG